MPMTQQAADADVCSALAETFHEDGFVVLDEAACVLSSTELTQVHAAVMTQYDRFMHVAQAEGIDLRIEANSEVIPGFYVRKGGRIDMQLGVSVSRNAVAPPVGAGGRVATTVEPVDTTVLHALESHWRPVVDAIFRPTDEQDAMAYYLEYMGCVVARPGDSDQNWHLDGVHYNTQVHEPVDRLNVFVPLVAITEAIGGTEMKKRSQFHDQGRRGTLFAGYAELESVTPAVSAGTPIIMDYRVWHRGLANTSDTPRPLLYFKYVRRADRDPRHQRSGKRAGAMANSVAPGKKKRKIIPLQVVS